MVRRQLRSEYKEEDLGSEGLRIFTTLDPRVQNAAGAAFISSLDRLRKSAPKRLANLQGAVLVSNPENGELLAIVGGAGEFTGYNRALDARRQVGSLMKPAVYLTALNSGKYTLVTPLDDGPVSLEGQGGQRWEPKNDDGESHGILPLYSALAHSYNQATIRMGMDIGVPAVIDTLKQLGVQQSLPSYPSLMLGAVDMSPMDILSLYQVYASGGFRAPPRSIREVIDANGKPLRRYGLAVQQVFDPAPVYLLNYALQQTMREGTAAAAYQTLPSSLVMAGKTGTTNDLRDAWFAGYTSNLICVIWVGNDDYSDGRLQGAQAAVPIWADFMKRAVQLPQYSDTRDFPIPQGVNLIKLDKNTNLLADQTCPDDYYAAFLDGTAPTNTCSHPNGDQRNFFQKIFGLGGAPQEQLPPSNRPTVLPPHQPQPPGAPGAQNAENNQQEEKPKAKKRGFFSKLFGMGKKDDQQQDQQDQNPQ